MKNPKIAFIIFNTLDKRCKLILENLEVDLDINLWSGFLLKKNIKNDILLFLSSDNKTEENRSLCHLIDYCKKEKYDLIFISKDHPSEITNEIKKKLGNKIRDLSSIEKIFNFHPNFYYKFYPNFKYKFFGTEKIFIQKAVSLLFYGCLYSQGIKNNRFYDNLDWENKRKWKGCSYCSSAFFCRKLSFSQKVKILKNQIKYLRKELPFLKIIEVPSPLSENFIGVLSKLVKEANLKSLSFYIFLRPDDLVKNKYRIEALLQLMKKKGCSFFVENIGFENFSRKELAVLNRGYGPEVNIEAIKTFFYFRKKYPKTWITKNTSASFILFEPFTDIEDLKINTALIIQFKKYFLSFYRVSFNKLRITKDTPIYRLARNAGLISGRNLNNYCFKNSKIGKIYKSYIKLFDSSTANNQSQRAIFSLIKSLV